MADCRKARMTSRHLFCIISTTLYNAVRRTKCANHLIQRGFKEFGEAMNETGGVDRLGLRKWAVLISVVLLQFAAKRASASVITFSEQPSGTGALNPSTYTSGQGLPVGVSAVFTAFRRLDAGPDHTPTDDEKLIVSSSDIASTITFNTPVEVPSLFISPGDNGSPRNDTITGNLAGAMQFKFTGSSNFDFQEITLGVGKPIDQLVFSSFLDSEVDDISIIPVPEPATAMSIFSGLLLCSVLRATRSPPSPPSPSPSPPPAPPCVGNGNMTLG
jgi:hypothetical protein